MVGKIKDRLAAIGRRLLRWIRQVLAAPVWLLRTIARLPILLWRGLTSVLRFLVELPRRLWRALVAAVRFLVGLPRRLWRTWTGAVRFVIGLPGRARHWLAVKRRQLHLRLREGRARLASWWRTRVVRHRTFGPVAQVLTIFALLSSVTLLLAFSSRLVQLSGNRTTVVVVTATADAGASAPRVTATPEETPPVRPSAIPPTRSDPLAAGGTVAFAMRRDGNTDLYARQLGDEQLLRLTYHPAVDREAAWAPDGETLAFVSHRGDNWDVYRLDVVSGVLIRLTREAHFDGHPSWSPDGAFIAFESYRAGNLDIYLMAANGSQVQQLTAHQAADMAPAWSPDGRHIAFVSYRDGSKDIFLYPLDAGSEAAVSNLTQTPDRDESAPTWSSDGSRLAFSVGRFGQETIYVTTFDWNSKFLDEAQTQLFNPGVQPDWSPDGSSLIYEYQRAGSSYLIADRVTDWGTGRELFSAQEPIQDPNWSTPTADTRALAQARQSVIRPASALYLEEILPRPSSGPAYTIVPLRDVNGGDDREFLSDRVDDSFAALRQRVLEETGVDYLSTIGDSFRRIDVPPPPGQSPRNWHKAGRAFDLNQGLYEREEQLVELMREDIGFRTYWRVYLRAARQDGSLGEPLRGAPWDLKARREGGLAAREGGALKEEVPLGYYVDFTQLAADYGWERVPANTGWRQQWADINWWQYQKTQGLSWLEAMQELYRPDQIEAVFGPLAEQGS